MKKENEEETTKMTMSAQHILLKRNILAINLNNLYSALYTSKLPMEQEMKGNIKRAKRGRGKDTKKRKHTFNTELIIHDTNEASNEIFFSANENSTHKKNGKHAKIRKITIR